MHAHAHATSHKATKAKAGGHVRTLCHGGSNPQRARKQSAAGRGRAGRRREVAGVTRHQAGHSDVCVALVACAAGRGS